MANGERCSSRNSSLHVVLVSSPRKRQRHHAEHDECQFWKFCPALAASEGLALNGHASPASLDVERIQRDGKYRSVLLESVSSSGVQMALVGDRRRRHGQLDV